MKETTLLPIFIMVLYDTLNAWTAVREGVYKTYA